LLQQPSIQNLEAESASPISNGALCSCHPTRPYTQCDADHESNAELLSRLSKCLSDDDETNFGYSASVSAACDISQRSDAGVAKDNPAPDSAFDGHFEPSGLKVRNAGLLSHQRVMQAAAFRPKTPIWTLCNPGNLCFLNSLLQNLARLSPLIVMLGAAEDSCFPVVDANANLALAFNHFCRQVNSDGRKSMRASKTTEMFHRVLPHLIAPFASGRQRQQDAHEVLLRLIEKLDEDGTSNGLCFFNIFDQRQTQRFGHPLSAICAGLIQQEMKCSKCTFKSEKNETFLCLSVSIPVQAEISVGSMMSAYFSRVEVQYRCSKCDCSTAVLQQKVGLWPTVLIIHFLRWRGGSKISTNIKIPQMWSFPSDKSCPIYKLNGYILHHGPQANVGHYTAVVLISSNGSDEYFRVSDDLMDSKAIEKTVYSREGFPSTTCYLAFYVITEHKL
jgi:ubiquitin C-terminal hydrolase